MKWKLVVDGMNCGHCVKALTEALQAMPGISDLHVDVGHASFAAASPPAEATLREVVDEAGFDLVSITPAS